MQVESKIEILLKRVEKTLFKIESRTFLITTLTIITIDALFTLEENSSGRALSLFHHIFFSLLFFKSFVKLRQQFIHTKGKYFICLR
jgi:hypothetical protein